MSNGQTGGWTEKWMDRRMVGQIDGRTDRWIGKEMTGPKERCTASMADIHTLTGKQTRDLGNALGKSA